jgi:hypothetical protein
MFSLKQLNIGKAKTMKTLFSGLFLGIVFVLAGMVVAQAEESGGKSLSPLLAEPGDGRV